MKKKASIIIACTLIIGLFVYHFQCDKVSYQSGSHSDAGNLDYMVKNEVEVERNYDYKDRISSDLLLSGGVSKDDIPAIDNPQFVDADFTAFRRDELIIGVYHNGEAKAYPYSILNWHEIVNDTIGGTPITVSYCPLCETNSVFVRKINGEETSFGVSGRLFQSCLVMYDRKTETLWSQPWGIGVKGDSTNLVLDRIPAIRTTLGKWKNIYPDTQVMTTDTGYGRKYFSYPYDDYYTSEDIIFPVRNQEERSVHPKAITHILWQHDEKPPQNFFSGDSYAVTQHDMWKEKKRTIQFMGKEVDVIWDEELQTVRFMQEGRELPHQSAFGFVYPAFFE